MEKKRIPPPPPIRRPGSTHHHGLRPEPSATPQHPTPRREEPPPPAVVQPVVIQPVVRTQAPVRNQTQQLKAVPVWWIAAVAAVIALVLGTTHYLLVTKPEKDFVPDYEVVEVTRSLPALAEMPNWDEAITPEKFKSITQGKGLKLVLLTRENGKRKNREEVVLVKPEPSPSPGPRKQMLAEARETMGRRVEALNALEVPAVKFAVFVDSTSGDLELLSKQLELQLSSSLVEQTTKRGYAVKVYFHRLTSSPAYVPNFAGLVEIPAGAAAGAGQQEIAEKREEIANNLKRDDASSLINGILNAIYEDGLKPGDHVLVFSDGLECCKLFNWENGSLTDVTEDKWGGIFQKMEAAVPNQPALAGLYLDWYLPARDEKADMMAATIKVWKAFFQRPGKAAAAFQVHQ